MRSPLIKATAAGFATALVAAAVVIPPASASTTGALPFSQAHFSGYATGDELHIGTNLLDNVSQITGLQLNSLDQGLSSATTNSSGLTSSITSELGTVIQPAQSAAIKAFDEGDGLSLNLGQVGQTVSNVASSILGTLSGAIPAPVIVTAPPNIPGVTTAAKAINLDPILDTSLLGEAAQANFPTESCPSSDISFGSGDLTSSNILTGLPALTTSGVSTQPLISTSGDGTSVSQSKSVTQLHPNGDGTYGIQTQAGDIIAPITVNLLGLAQLQIAVKSAGGVSDPVTLTATTTGENSGASLVPSTDDILDANLIYQTLGGQTQNVSLVHVPLSTLIGTSGLKIPLTLNGLTQALSQISVPTVVVQTLQQLLSGLNQVANNSTVSNAIDTVNSVLGTLQQQLGAPVTNVINTLTAQPTVKDLLGALTGILNLSLGELDISMTPHPLHNSTATAIGGTQAGGAMDLLNLHLVSSGTINIGGQTIPAGLLPGLPAISVPALGQIPLPTINLLDFTAGHLETQSIQQEPIACGTTAAAISPVKAPPAPQKALPFTGGPGGLWQPAVGIGTLGLGGFSLALVRRLRKRSAA